MEETFTECDLTELEDIKSDIDILKDYNKELHEKYKELQNIVYDFHEEVKENNDNFINDIFDLKEIVKKLNEKFENEIFEENINNKINTLKCEIDKIKNINYMIVLSSIIFVTIMSLIIYFK